MINMNIYLDGIIHFCQDKYVLSLADLKERQKNLLCHSKRLPKLKPAMLQTLRAFWVSMNNIVSFIDAVEDNEPPRHKNSDEERVCLKNKRF